MYHDDHEANGNVDDDAYSRRQRTPSPSPVTAKKMRLSPALSRPTTSNGASGSGSSVLKPLSLSILGTEPHDDFILTIANFVHDMIMNRPKMDGHVEVEAKLGLLKPRGADERVMFPVHSETSAHCSKVNSVENLMNLFQSLLAMITGSSRI